MKKQKERPVMIQAIDTHCHVHYGPLEKLEPNNMTHLMQEGNCYSAYPDVLLKNSKAAGISRIFASPFDGLFSTARTEEANEKMAELAQETKELYQWVIIDPRNPKTYLQAEQMLKHEKCVGIKLHPHHLCHNYDLADWGDEIFSFAQKHEAVVLIHPDKNPEYLVPFANRYPGATLIAAHLGSEHHIEAVRQAVHRNLYIDTATSGCLKNRIVEYAVSQIGSDRILFGTDTYSAAMQRGRIEFAPLPEADKENILLRNAQRLFHLAD